MVITDIVENSISNGRNVDELRDIFIETKLELEKHLINQWWPNFLDRGPFSEMWTKATTHNSIFSLSCKYVL